MTMLGLFTWITPGKLVAGRAPLLDRDYQSWRDAGVRLVINLHTKADSAGRLEKYGLEELHVPIRDYSAPDTELIDLVVARINDSINRGEVVAVHCRAGLGRTGTVIACWLVNQGYTADSAISRVRELRRGSIETVGQEQAVEAYAERRRLTEQ